MLRYTRLLKSQLNTIRHLVHAVNNMHCDRRCLRHLVSPLTKTPAQLVVTSLCGADISGEETLGLCSCHAPLSRPPVPPGLGEQQVLNGGSRVPERVAPHPPSAFWIWAFH